MTPSNHDPDQEPTKEMPVYRGSASVPVPVTAIPYSEPTFVARPRRRWPTVLLTIFAVGLILVACGAFAGYALFGASTNRPPAAQTPPAKVLPSPTIDPPRAVTEKFLAAVLDGNDAGIQEHLCGLLKSSGNEDNSGGLGLGIVVGYKVGEEKVQALSATVKVELTVPLLGSLNFDIYLIRETAGWRVCGGSPS